MDNEVRNEEPADYSADPIDDRIIANAIKILEARQKFQNAVKSPEDLKNLLKLKLVEEKTEKFGVVYVNHGNFIIADEIVEHGIENRAQVYIKKIAKRAMDLNATGVFLYHNHPAGNTKFSDKDISLTSKIKSCFEVLEIRVIDHFLIAGAEVVSMVETEGHIF